MPRDPSILNGILGEALRRLDLEKGVKAQHSKALWARVAGEAVARATRAGDIRNGTLYVYTRSSAWSHELSFLRDTLRARLNEELGGEVVTDLRFQVKKFEAEAETDAEPPPARELTTEETAALRALSETAGEEVGPHMEAFAARQWRRHRLGAACSVCGGPVHEEQTVCPFCRPL